MLEIKFKGKSTKDGRWVFGFIADTLDKTVLRITRYDGELYTQIMVFPFTVSQYIGLKDSKGNEIYNGDILKCYNKAAKDDSWGLEKEHIGVIEYTAPLFSLKIPGKLIYDGGAVKQWENDVYLNEWYNAEVIEKIGTIFDNPELLK